MPKSIDQEGEELEKIRKILRRQQEDPMTEAQRKALLQAVEALCRLGQHRDAADLLDILTEDLRRLQPEPPDRL